MLLRLAAEIGTGSPKRKGGRLPHRQCVRLCSVDKVSDGAKIVRKEVHTSERAVILKQTGHLRRAKSGGDVHALCERDRCELWTQDTIY